MKLVTPAVIGPVACRLSRHEEVGRACFTDNYSSRIPSVPESTKERQQGVQFHLVAAARVNHWVLALVSAIELPPLFLALARSSVASGSSSSTVATSPRPHAWKLSASQFAVSYAPAAADSTAANFWGSSTPTRAARLG
jgi:hypothetical protein